MTWDTAEAALAAARDGVLDDRCAAVAALAAMPGDQATRALASLLDEASWFLRERVVAALAKRTDALDLVLEVVEGGTWFAKASGCDVLAGMGDERALPALLAQLGDRNVSVQKSAAGAVERLAERCGDDAVAREIARLAPDERRRVMARLGHQSPAWTGRLATELAGLPAEAFAPEEEKGASEEVPAASRAASAAEELRTFRRWLARLHSAGE